jgi:hypothetical protein
MLHHSLDPRSLRRRRAFDEAVAQCPGRANWNSHGFDFLALTDLPWQPDLVLCNPPFNGIRYKQWRLGSEAFLQKIFELCGEDQKIVLFSPMGLRLNVERRAARAKHLPTWNITSLVSLPRDFFGKDVTVHAEMLFFVMPKLKPHCALRWAVSAHALRPPLHQLGSAEHHLASAVMWMSGTISEEDGMKAILASIAAMVLTASAASAQAEQNTARYSRIAGR